MRFFEGQWWAPVHETAQYIPRADLERVRDAMDAFARKEFSLKADWLGLCPMRHAIYCQGSDGHNSALGTPKPKPHKEGCPYSGLRETLAILDRALGKEGT